MRRGARSKAAPNATVKTIGTANSGNSGVTVGATVLQNPATCLICNPQISRRVECEALRMIQTRRGGTEHGGRGAAREVRLPYHYACGFACGERSRILQDSAVTVV